MADLVCDSCDKPKAELKIVESRVLKDTQLTMCRSCIENKFEPRWCLIIAGRSYGVDVVKWFINNKRYFGDIITFSEIIK